MIKSGMSIAEKVRIKASPEWKEYMNSRGVVDEHGKLVPTLRDYKDRRADVHAKHKRE